jgi:capsular polysaccharide biosynthesis protein
LGLYGKIHHLYLFKLPNFNAKFVAMLTIASMVMVVFQGGLAVFWLIPQYSASKESLAQFDRV